MAMPNNPINFSRLAAHFFDGVKENVAIDLQPDAYQEVLAWVSSGPVVITGNWYIRFTHFIMVGTDGVATNAISLSQKPFTGSQEIFK